jgi:hypothetical protein
VLQAAKRPLDGTASSVQAPHRFVSRGISGCSRDAFRQTEAGLHSPVGQRHFAAPRLKSAPANVQAPCSQVADLSGDGRPDLGLATGANTPVLTNTTASTTAITIASNHNPATPGQTVTYTATLNPAGSTGAVAFLGGGVLIPGCESKPIDSGGHAGCQTSYTAGGTHTITARYTGVGYTGDSLSSPLTETVAGPTVALLRSFKASQRGNSIVVRWQTGTEASTLGFNLYEGPRRLNHSLIRAQASGRASGSRYQFRTEANGSSSYRLELVQLDGSRRSYRTRWQ